MRGLGCVMFVMEKEERMLVNAVSVKVRELSSRWFKLDLECSHNRRKLVNLAKEWETPLEKQGNVKLVKAGRSARREWIFRFLFLLVRLQVTQ